MEKFLHIKPTFDCILRTQNNEVTLKENEQKSFLLKTEETSLPLFFYPLGGSANSIPFCANLNLSNLSTKSNNVEVISFPNDSVLLLVEPFLLKTPTLLGTKSKPLTFAGESHTLYYGIFEEFFIKIENKNDSFSAFFDKKITNLSTKTVGNTLFIYAKTVEDTYVVAILEYEKTYKLRLLENVDLLEVDKDKILTFKNLHDLCQHGTTCEYNFSGKFQCKSDIVYVDNEPKTTFPEHEIPIAFLQCVKVGNIPLARKFLSEDLSSILDDAHLKSYFGAFLSILPPLEKEKEQHKVALIYEKSNMQKFGTNTEFLHKNTPKEAKIFTFEINSNLKISNILEN